MSSDFLIDGMPPTDEDLRYMALVNYGAVTSFRVEEGGVRGLDLHMDRLHASAIELFGKAVTEARLRDLMRLALGDKREAWLRVSLFSPHIWARLPSDRVLPKVMTVVAPPPPPLATSVRAEARTYVRDAAHLKHTATLPLIRARRLAHDAGFDDAVFVDADGLISEGVSWNIGFLSGDTVTWPQAPMLAGVAQALISRGLADVDLTERAAPVHLADLDRFDGAFLCNSATPACPITAIGEHLFDPTPERIERVARAWSSNTPQPI